MTHLVDLKHAPCDCANHGLETLYKAIAEQPNKSAIWRPHENPYLTDIIEHWHAEQAARVQEAQDAIFGALGLGEPVPLLRKALSTEEIAALRARLAKPMRDYSPADWVALIDLAFHTRLSGAALERAAADLAAKATLAGQLHAIADPDAETGIFDLLHRVAIGAASVPRALSGAAKRAMDWAKSRIGLHLRGITEAGRDRVAHSILDHVQEHGLASAGKLQQRLLDDFATQNRDWRRVAITEAGETANLAYAGSFPDGTRIKRIEHYDGACPFCRKLNGQVFIWSADPRPDSDGWTHIWPGKTNVGRSASPRKQTPDGLVERTEDELWWPAAGVQHPNCRGRWLALPGEPPATVDPDFADWVRRELESV